jgi:hypothetical protein
VRTVQDSSGMTWFHPDALYQSKQRVSGVRK